MALKYLNYAITFIEFPGESALCINITNCPCHCKGCHSSIFAEDIGTELTDEELLKLVNENIDEITCVGFMGGDIDNEEVIRLAKLVKTNFKDLRVGWYSGRNIEPKDAHILDYMKLGPYIESKGGLQSKDTNQIYYINVNGKFIDITEKAFRCGTPFDYETYIKLQN